MPTANNTGLARLIPPRKKLAFALLLLFLTFLIMTVHIARISSALGCLESIEVKGSEPIEVQVVHSFDRHFYPGQQTSLMLTIRNEEHETCDITVTETHTFPEGVYMLARIGGFKYTFGEKFAIKPSQTIPLNITIVAPGDAGTGAVKLTIMISTTLQALSVTISPGSATLYVGQCQLFTSSVTGGASPYTYQWYLNGAPVCGATKPTWTFIPTSAGSYAVYVKVTDSVGMKATSNTATVTVNRRLSVCISPSSVDMHVGQSELFTSSVVGGTPPYAYQWYLNGAPVSGATNPTWTFTPTSPGSYTVYVKVTDSAGMEAKSNTVSARVKGNNSAHGCS
jgi:archaellum component FlaG (FlaF/FlaG flagellin family)